MMTTYVYIESFFRSILSQSKTIEGRFYILPRGGEELNSDNLSQVLSEAGPVTYPLCGMIPPMSTGNYTSKDLWETFHFTLFFLSTTYYQDGQIKDVIDATQTSGRSVVNEWDAMKRAATDFIRVLDFVQRGTNSTAEPLATNLFRLDPRSKNIQTVSFATTKRLSGVRLEFDAKLYLGCDVSDYDDGVYFVIPAREEGDTLIISGPNDLDRLITNEVPTGVLNGSNATFTSVNSFVPETVEVFLNGIKQKIILDYQLVGGNQIVFKIAPDAGEVILINYIKL